MKKSKLLEKEQKPGKIKTFPLKPYVAITPAEKFLAKNLYLQTKDTALVLGITQDRIDEAYRDLDLELQTV